MDIQRRVIVSGRVQGVGFRASTVKEASRFPSLRGYVRNLADGRVEVLLAGPDSAVLSMAAWCEHGPRWASVESTEIRDEPVDPELSSFRVRR